MMSFVYVGKLAFAPARHGFHHGLEVSLHLVHADGERVDEREVLAVFGEHRLEVAVEGHVLANEHTVLCAACGYRQHRRGAAAVQRVEEILLHIIREQLVESV